MIWALGMNRIFLKREGPSKVFSVSGNGQWFCWETRLKRSEAR